VGDCGGGRCQDKGKENGAVIYAEPVVFPLAFFTPCLSRPAFLLILLIFPFIWQPNRIFSLFLFPALFFVKVSISKY